MALERKCFFFLLLLFSLFFLENVPAAEKHGSSTASAVSEVVSPSWKT